jgi:CBS-domain-containing membrane protein
LELLPEAAQTMVAHNVLSLPVLTQEGKYHAFIDMMDIVKHLINAFEKVASPTKVDIEKYFATEAKFSQTQVHEVIRWPLTKKNVYHPVKAGSTLFTALELCAIADVHRIAVTDDDDNLVDVVTQSMLIDFLWQNLESIGKAANAKVSALPSSPNVLSVNLNDKAIDAFKLMLQHDVSGIAVVDDKGKLVDNISNRDLKAIRPDIKAMWRLWTTIADLKAHVRAEFSTHPISLVPVTVTEDDLVTTVIEKMALQHVHRVFVVDAAKKPLRVISETDILRAIHRGFD